MGSLPKAEQTVMLHLDKHPLLSKRAFFYANMKFCGKEINIRHRKLPIYEIVSLSRFFFDDVRIIKKVRFLLILYMRE